MPYFASRGRTRARSASAVVFVLTALFAGCGGGGSAVPADGPAVPAAAFDLIYPGKSSLTDANRITVVGVADRNEVSSVIIRNGANDVTATIDPDGRWRADAVPLQRGFNELIADLTLADGSVDQRNVAGVDSLPVLSRPFSALFDASGDRVLVADGSQLLAFDVETGSLEVISSARIGTGPEFDSAQQLALAGDGAILVADLRHIRRVDPATGNRTDHVEFPGQPPLITSIAHDEQLNRLFILGFAGGMYVADLNASSPILATTVRPPPTFGVFPAGSTDSVYVAGTDTVYTVNTSTLEVSAIDGTTGEREVLMLDTSAGPVTPTVGIDYDEVESRLLVLGLSGAVFSLDPVTGTSGVLIPAPSTTGSIKAINGLSLGTGKLWTVSPATSELISMDSTTGDQTVEARSRLGGGVVSGVMPLGRYDAAADRFVAVSDLRLIAIDLETGSRELLANLVDPPLPGQAPQQPALFVVNGLALSQDGTRAWLTDPLRGALVAVDLASGQRQEISGQTAGTGTLPDQPVGVAVDPDETTAWVGDRFAARVFRINLATGQRDALSFTLDGSEIRDLVLDSDANRLLLSVAPTTPASTVPPGIYALDLSGIEPTLVADFSGVESPFAATPASGFPTRQLSLDADRGILFSPVAGNRQIPYVRVDTTLGTVEPLADGSHSPAYFLPSTIDQAPDGRLFALDRTNALFLIDPRSGERVIVSK